MELLKHENMYEVIRHIFKENELEIGSHWIDSSYKTKVTIDKIENGFVYYSNSENEQFDKDVFCFQTRYSLIVNDLKEFECKYPNQFNVVDSIETEEE